MTQPLPPYGVSSAKISFPVMQAPVVHAAPGVDASGAADAQTAVTTVDTNAAWPVNTVLLDSDICAAPRTQTFTGLPTYCGVRAVNIDAYTLSDATRRRTIVNSVFVPTASSRCPVVLDMQALAPEARLPDLFIVSDAAPWFCFTGVDNRPGTPLRALVVELAARIRAEAALIGNTSPEALRQSAYCWVRDHVRDFIDYPPSGSKVGVSALPWDEGVAIRNAIVERMRAALKGAQVGAWVGSVELLPVVAIDDKLRHKTGSCLDMALLGKLILQELDAPCRVRQLSLYLADSDERPGHVDLELPDGRVLDPAWRTFVVPGPAHSACEGSTFVSGPQSQGYRYPLMHYFFVAAPV